MGGARLVAITLLAACSAPPREVSPGPPQDAPPFADAGFADAGAALCTSVAGEPELALELVASGLRQPAFLISPPGDRRLFVLEQDRGRIRIIKDGVLLTVPFLDLDHDLGGGMEQGLFSLAFHPDYASNGRFFVTYSLADKSLVLAELHVTGDPDLADAASEIRLIQIEHTTNFHYGASLAFGADGRLYMSSGDGGPHRDTGGWAQNLGSLRGKLLRLDVDSVPGDYAIPPDNPLVGVAGAAEEVYAYGLRNPWRIDFDPATQHLYIGDAGFATREEIDVLPYGSAGPLNFGWPILEGSMCLDGIPCDPTGTVPPVREHTHADGCAIIGGAVYRGCAMPGHHGKYFWGDFCGQWVRSMLYLDGQALVMREWDALAPVGRQSSFGRDALGELYVLDWDEGTVQRIVPAPGE